MSQTQVQNDNPTTAAATPVVILPSAAEQDGNILQEMLVLRRVQDLILGVEHLITIVGGNAEPLLDGEQPITVIESSCPELTSLLVALKVVNNLGYGSFSDEPLNTIERLIQEASNQINGCLLKRLRELQRLDAALVEEPPEALIELMDEFPEVEVPEPPPQPQLPLEDMLAVELVCRNLTLPGERVAFVRAVSWLTGVESPIELDQTDIDVWYDLTLEEKESYLTWIRQRCATELRVFNRASLETTARKILGDFIPAEHLN